MLRNSAPLECRKGYTIPFQLIEPACPVLLDLARDVTCCQISLDGNLCTALTDLHNTAAGKYSERAFQALDYILDEASKVGVRLILTMADNWSPVDSKSQVFLSS